MKRFMVLFLSYVRFTCQLALELDVNLIHPRNNVREQSVSQCISLMQAPHLLCTPEISVAAHVELEAF